MGYGYGYGYGLMRRGAGTSGSGVSLTAPVLTWTSAETDATPEFEIDADFQADDIIHIYRDGIEVAAHTLTSEEIASTTVNLGLGAWPDGTYAVTATIERNGVESDPSNTATVTLVPDVTAPGLSSASGTQTGATTASLSVATDEDNGTLYAFVSTSATPPTATDLKAGTGAAYASSQAVSSTGTKTVSATGLTATTTYYAHFLHSDAAGNDSDIATSASFTTLNAPGAPPVFSTTAILGSPAPTFSNANKTVLFNAAEDIVLVSSAALTGKVAIAFSLDVHPGGYASVGLAVPSAYSSPTQGLGRNGANELAVFENSTGGSTALFSPLPWDTVGAMIGIVYDEPNGLIWTTVDGVAFSGATKAQVEAGTNGVSTSALEALGAVSFAVGNGFSVSGQQLTILDEWPWTLPAGYSYATEA